ncbi:serine-rich adhesin for platelets-like isoform X16 [Eriocheir sinensis]|uniref:serine-rich adhesin for platelets-like isoform X16 n=1 Tax=Eriocheir sinensis TaxID=95602 RepID=UPI0021C85B99|nr:serine-rich adhesin for platelets-like isoform X16 [Eriocheir sinensis]
MDNSMDRHLNTSNRKLLQNFREVMEPKDTPSPVRYQAAAMKKRPPKGSLNRSKQKSRPSIGSRGGENLRTEVLHRRSEQSFMDQTLNVSVIQGINQTYANIAAPDSSESSFNSSIDLEKGARFRKQKKGKLETAPLPAEMKMTRPALKKKKKVAQSSSTSKEAGPRQKFITHNTVAQDTQDVEAQDKSKGFSTEAGIAKKTQSMPPEATSPQGAEHSLRTSANMDVSSISASSRRSDATYDFTADYDETLPNILDTKRKFRSKLSSRKLNLPSLIEALQAKQSSASPVTVSDILDTLNAPEVQVSSPDKGSQEPLEASDEESNESHSPATSGDDEAILPPLSFRDDEANRSTILRDTFFSDVDNTSRIRLHLEETDGDMNQNPLPKTPAPPEDEDMIVDLQKSASAAQGNGMSQVIDASPIKTPPRPSLGPITEVTPTKSSSSDMAQVNDPATSTGSPAQSSLKESKGQSIDDSSPRSLEDVGQVTDANTIRTPIRSSPRRSVGQASANKLSRSVGQVADAITTPIRSSPRRSVGQTSASKLSRSMGQVTDVITTPIRSSPRRSVGQVTDVITTPIRSSPRRSVGQASASRLSKNLGQVTDVIATPIRSSPRRSVGQVSASKSSRRSVGQVSASKSSRRSVGQVTDVTTTKTPTRSSLSGSVGQVTDATTTRTLTRSSLSGSVGQVTDVTTTKAPTESSPSGSVGQVTDVTTTKTPTRISPRQGLKRNLGSVLVSPQKGSVEDNTVMDVSLGRSRNAEARHRDTTPIISEATPAEEGDESEEEENPKKRTRTSQSLPEDDEHSSFSDFENEYSLIPITARTPPRYRRDIHEGYEVRDEEVETSPLTIEASPPPPPPPETPIKEQPSTSASTAKVRQMTMREFLEQLKKKPVQPPLTRPTPLLPSLLGTAPSSSQLKPRGRPKGKTRRKKQLPASVSKRLTKEIFTQFAKCRVSKRALDEVVKITEIFWENLVDDVCAMQTTKKHPTKSIQPEDVEKLMKRQGLITSKESLEVLVEQLLPMEMWSFFKTFPEPAHNPFPSFTGPFYET